MTLDQLPVIAQTRIRRILGNLPAEWQVADIEGRPADDSVSYNVRVVDATGAPAAEISAWVGSEE
jgi:hypothetical protein